MKHKQQIKFTLKEKQILNTPSTNSISEICGSKKFSSSGFISWLSTTSLCSLIVSLHFYMNINIYVYIFFSHIHKHTYMYVSHTHDFSSMLNTETPKKGQLSPPNRLPGQSAMQTFREKHR